jgi:ribosomal-protein-alanine N-acetyltransferase
MSPGGLGLDRVTTARLVGRRPEPADLGAVLAFFCDPRVDDETWPPEFRTPERGKEAHEANIAHWERWGFGPWLLELDGQVIGWDGLRHDTVDGRPEVEVLWFVSPDHWGKGYGTEMAREAVRVAFEVLELDSIVSYTVTSNAASRAIMEKLGMTYERDIVNVGLPHVLYRLSR